MYFGELGVPQDYAEVRNWYRKAADQGEGLAQVGLGLMYEAGWGIPQDYVQAHKWYNLAASRLPPGEDRDKAADGRNDVAAKMTAAQVAEAQRLAREWKPKTQETGNLQGSPLPAVYRKFLSGRGKSDFRQEIL